MKKLLLSVILLTILLAPIGVTLPNYQANNPSVNSETSLQDSNNINTPSLFDNDTKVPRDVIAKTPAETVKNITLTSEKLENLTRIKMEHSYTYMGVIGNFTGLSEYEYVLVNFDNATLEFYNMTSGKIYAKYNDTYSTGYYPIISMETANLDSDSYDELIVLNESGYLYLIDNDLTTLKIINLNLWDPPVQGWKSIHFLRIADLDSNGIDDAVITLDDASYGYVMVLNGTLQQITASFITYSYNIAGSTVGNFNDSDGLEIAVSYYNRSLAIYSNNLTRIANRTFSCCSPFRIATYSYASWNYDALILQFTNDTSNFDIYNATTLQSMGYNDTIDIAYGTSTFEPVTGDLTGDGTDEIIFPTGFPDGYGLSVYDLNAHKVTDKIRLISDNFDIRGIKVAKITADNKYDIIFLSQHETVIFKGVENPDTDIEFLRKIDEPTWIRNAFVAQYNDGLDDVFIDSAFALYIYPTDSSPPRLTNLLVNPVRPTVDDSMFYLSANVLDESDFPNPSIRYNFTTFEGTQITTNENMQFIKSAHGGSEYSAYFFNIRPGIYTYKIILTDIYDNQRIYDNNGTLYNVTVYSSNIYSKQVQDVIEGAVNAMAVGNLDSDVYSDIIVAGETNISIVWGNNTYITAIMYQPVSAPTVYVGTFDDIAGDDIALAFYNTTSAKYEVNVYNGINFNLIQNYSFASNITMLKTGDITADGHSELIIVEEDLNKPELRNLYIIDVFHNETLQSYTNLPHVNCLLIANVSSDAYLDVAILLSEKTGNTFNLTVIAGGPTAASFQTLYSYNSTYYGDIIQAFLFLDHFVSLNDKQFLIVLQTYAPYLYVINSTDGTPVDPSKIPYTYISYTTGLTVVDVDYDGLKELAYLGYDNQLVVISLVYGYLYSVPTTIPSAPFSTYWVNFDEEPHNDLVLILPTAIYVFSPYSKRLESVSYSFTPIASVNIGNFFQLPFFDVCILTVTGTVNKYININTFYRLKIDVHLTNDTIPQGDYLDVSTTITNVFNDTIKTASVLGILSYGTNIVQVASFISLNNGTYLLTQTLNNLPMGIYTLSIDISESYYGHSVIRQNITLLGNIVPYVDVESYIDIYTPVVVNVTLVDPYSFPVYNASVSATFAGLTYSPNVTVGNTYIFYLNRSNLKVGEYSIEFTATHSYAVKPISFSSSVTIKSEPKVEFAGNGITEPPVVQGNPINLRVTLRDATNHTLTGGTITATFFGKLYTFSDLGNGTYTTSILTQNIPGGRWRLTVEVTHPYLVSEIFAGNITVRGSPVMTYSINPGMITQNSEMTINVTLVDLYGYPITNANVTIEFLGRSYQAENIEDNIYQVTIPVGNVHYGFEYIYVHIRAENHASLDKSVKIFIYPEIPRLELSPSALLILLGVSIFASFIGLCLYYYISSKLMKSFTYDEQGRLTMSFKSLDRAYIAFIGVLLLTLAAAEVLYLTRAYELSVATLGLALLEILLLHGIWLYRDTATSMIEERLPVKRMIIGLWHLVLAPLVILLIFAWARNIDWFAYYLLEDIQNVAGLKLPSLYISLMGTYVTSIIVLAINIYLNSRRYIKRFSEMRIGGTPESVINDEKVIQLDRMSSSIRIKFLIFLGILGTSIVSTATPLLQYYQLGVVVIIPLVVIVIIPYLISQLLKVLGIAKRVTKKIAAPVMGTQGPKGTS